MKKSSLITIIILCVVAILAGTGIYFFTRPQSELKNINSDAELYSFYDHSSTYSSPADNPLVQLITLPYSALYYHRYYGGYYGCEDCMYEDTALDIQTPAFSPAKGETNDSASSGTKDYSTTNIQVENVDEADIIKTDGDYMYSISDDAVIISDVRDTSKPEIAARIESNDESIPEDLILSGDTLTIIGTEYKNGNFSTNYYSRYYSQNNTSVRVYDISDRKNPRLEKNFKLNQPYYTSRRIDNKLYVIASGRLRVKSSSDKLIDRTYTEDFVEKEFPVTSVRYLEDVTSDNLTLVSVFDLNNLDGDIVLEPFIIDITNAYVSENAFYLLEETYDSYENRSLWDEISPLFGFGGVFGLFDSYQNRYSNYSYTTKTEIYKFNIEKTGNISYGAKTKIDGRTINQYSLDENAGHLRIALEENYGSNGSYIAIFDENLNKLGESGRLGKGEKMHATRFIGDKAYLVTYKNTDPLFVVDLKDEKNPKVLGELKIPGYSVYLHPYDEDHLIGIGIDTEEETRKDMNGRVISSFAYITGMKLALFDISDFKNPKELSTLHIGNSRTSSAILTNPKALLFSKERNLIGIPVNNYESDFKIQIDETDDISDLTDSYSNYKSNYVNEGYIVYNINLEDGITERGEIIHEDSSLVRGAYINDDLITVSDNLLKINELKDLKLKAELNLTKEK